MNNIQIFSNANIGDIRVATTDQGEPLFCLADLCKALGLSNSRKVSQRLDPEDVTQSYTLTQGGKQQITFVTEPGMYTVILRSDSPKAKPMQKWVTSEVLPSIRKSGGYMISRTDETPEQVMARALRIADETLKRAEQEREQLREQNALQQKQLQASAPKAEYYDMVMMSKSTYNTNQIAHELGLSAVVLNRRLKDLGVQYCQGGQWLLYHKYRNKGYTGTKTYTYTNSEGMQATKTQTVWTEKGRELIHKLIKN